MIIIVCDDIREFQKGSLFSIHDYFVSHKKGLNQIAQYGLGIAFLCGIKFLLPYHCKKMLTEEAHIMIQSQTNPDCDHRRSLRFICFYHEPLD